MPFCNNKNLIKSGSRNTPTDLQVLFCLLASYFFSDLEISILKPRIGRWLFIEILRCVFFSVFDQDLRTGFRGGGGYSAFMPSVWFITKGLVSKRVWIRSEVWYSFKGNRENVKTNLSQLRTWDSLSNTSRKENKSLNSRCWLHLDKVIYSQTEQPCLKIGMDFRRTGVKNYMFWSKMGYKDLENWAAYTSIEFLRVPLGLLNFAGDKRTALIILPVGSKFTKKSEKPLPPEKWK